VAEITETAKISIDDRRRRVWLWVAGLILLMLLAWALTPRSGRGGHPQVRDDATRIGSASADPAPAPTAVDGGDGGEGMDHKTDHETEGKTDHKAEDREREEALRRRSRIMA